MESKVSSAAHADERAATTISVIIINKQLIEPLDGARGALACFVHCADNVDVKRGMRCCKTTTAVS
jgi:hypothetical protein